MTNYIYQNNIQPGKTYLPNPFPAHKLVIKKETLKNIMRVKGWKTYAHVGHALGFTRQYVAMIANGAGISSEFIVRLSLSLGNVNGNWQSIFDITPRGEFAANHPVWNQQKYSGMVPYEEYSISSNLRKKDYPVENFKPFC